MKHGLLLRIAGLWVWLLAVCVAQAAPADTVAGHAHLVRLLSAGMCARLQAESQTSQYDQLTKRQLSNIVEDWTTSIVMENEDEFDDALEQIGKYQRDAYKWRLAREALIRTAEKCAEARTFLVQVGWRNRNEKSLLGEAERAALLPAAQYACQAMDEENARQPLAQRPVAELQTVVKEAMGKAMLTKRTELSAYYGNQLFVNIEWTNMVGERLLLAVFDACPAYIVQLILGDKKRK